MTADEYEKLPPDEKEHFAECAECGEMFDRRSLTKSCSSITPSSIASAFAANQVNPRELLFRINISGRREVLRPIQCGSGDVDLARSAAYLVCERTAADLTKRPYRTGFTSIFLWLSLFEFKI
jgi:hypothetical protein